jgi:choline dehydrogenase-like flavoprotein
VTYDLVIAGTGFASSFFLLEYLRRAPGSARVLVLERGHRETRQWQLENRRTSRVAADETFRRTGDPAKTWQFTIGFGGGSNCWWGCAPRLLPVDFRLKSAYGVGDDWPLGYEDLEPFYEAAEAIMGISGAAGMPYPRRAAPPQPPHRLSEPDRRLAAAFPGLYVPQPTARARVAAAGRPACCATGVCGLCPIDAKFTIENGLGGPYADPRVTLRLGADVRRVETRAGRATGVTARTPEGDLASEADLVVLGAGALFNATVLERSGLTHRLLGRRLFEQLSVMAEIDLDGLDNFQGSTVITANGYMLYDGPHRAEAAACLIESWNRPDQLRWEPGRERELMQLKLIVEDVPQERNFVRLGADDLPIVHFEAYSDYALRGIQRATERLGDLLASLPVERVDVDPTPSSTEGHLLGTVVMGRDPVTSVVDPWMIHHAVRNLLVIGGSAFPTGSPANPTLTISALALRSADHLFS